MNKINVKELFIELRNGLCFSFTWLVICCMAIAIINARFVIPLRILMALFVLCFWAVLSFIVCFRDVFIKKKGFIFRLSLFYVMFIPAEVHCFFSMRVFKVTGTILEWTIFAIIVIGLYVTCVLIDRIVCKKQGERYTDKLLAYNERRAYEQRGIDK